MNSKSHDKKNNIKFDVLVIGGGIAGEETALNLAKIGHKVIIVEKNYSIGGHMVHLSKVFPTLDCSACISTPKMSETSRHPGIKILTFSEVDSVKKSGNLFNARIRKKPRYVNEDTCTGCQQCEKVCPIVVKDQYQYDLVGRKAVFIPFSIALPKIAAIDIDNCIICGACERICPANAIDFTQVEEYIEIEVKAVILATGFTLFNAEKLQNYGFGKFKNVIHSMQMERQLVPTRPFNSILRPGDGKVPDNIAYILCAGSRDRTLGNPICSQICCMYSIKQAQLLMGALPMADVTIYYIDIRAYGKGFYEFYEQTKNMGVEFKKGKIAKIEEKENRNLLLHFEDIENGGKHIKAEHDMVVLSLGILANNDVKSVFTDEQIQLDDFHYFKQTDSLVNPALTSIAGVFVAGTAAGPMDIPDTILSAGGASSEAASYIRGLK